MIGRTLSGLSRFSLNKVGASDRKKGDFKPGTAGDTTSTVEVSISCRNLTNKDVFSKSDPMCAVFYRPPGSKKWVPFMRTETIENDLDPDFAAKVTIEYQFEAVQMLRFELWDVDSDSAELDDQDNLGHCETSLAQIVTAGEKGLTLVLQGVTPSLHPQQTNKPKETIILTAEELASEKDEVILKLVGSSCGTWKACLPPKTYFSVSKLNDADKYLVVYRSNYARGTSPSWPPLRMTSRALCNGDHDRTLKIEIFQRNFQGESFSIGSTLTTLNKLLKSGVQERLQLISPDGKNSKSSVKIMQCTLTPLYTFLDYIKAGMEIHCIFAIDFTCSNGDPHDNRSLHYLGTQANGPNPYEQAIHAVGSIMKEYDKSSQFPVYGFGARLPPHGEPSYCFNLTLDKSPDCGSIGGVLETYRQCLNRIQLYAPTNFETVIRTVTHFASKSKSGENYYILIILTDGVISDMLKTKKAIIDACPYPMSIIIIGLGEADFDAMEELDGDAVPVVYNGKVAPRDIVQFVAYRSARAWMGATGEATVDDLIIRYEGGESGGGGGGGDNDLSHHDNKSTGGSSQVEEQKTNRLSESKLAKEIFYEIPAQVRSFMSFKSITPTIIKAKRKSRNDEGSQASLKF